MTSYLPSSIQAIIAFFVALIATCVGVWLWRKNHKAEKQEAAAAKAAGAPPAGSATDQVREQLRDAQAHLKQSGTMKGVSLTSLPVYLLIGPEKSGKTSL